MLACPIGDDAELRPLEPWQAAEFAAHVDRCRAHLAPWIPWALTITDEATARELLQSYADKQARDSGRIYGIWVGARLSGGVLFRSFDAAAGTCEIGVWLAPEALGRGLVTRAARRLIDWAVHERGLNRVEWLTMPENAASIATARRLGMTYEGTLREAFAFGGVRRDVQVWSLLARELTAS